MRPPCFSGRTVVLYVRCVERDDGVPEEIGGVVSPNLLMLAIFTLSAALSLGANNTVRYFFGSK